MSATTPRPYDYPPPGPVELWPALARRRRLVEAVVAWADRLHAYEDTRADLDGLTVERVGLTGRSYRDPRFDDHRMPAARLRASADGVCNSHPIAGKVTEGGRSVPTPDGVGYVGRTPRRDDPAAGVVVYLDGRAS